MAVESEKTLAEIARQGLDAEIGKWWPTKKGEIEVAIAASVKGVETDVRARVNSTVLSIEQSAKETVLRAVSGIEQRAFVVASAIIAALIAIAYLGARQAALAAQVEVQKELISLQKDLKTAREEADKATSDATVALRTSEDSLRRELEKVAEENRRLVALTSSAEATKKEIDTALARIAQSRRP